MSGLFPTCDLCRRPTANGRARLVIGELLDMLICPGCAAAVADFATAIRHNATTRTRFAQLRAMTEGPEEDGDDLGCPYCGKSPSSRDHRIACRAVSLALQDGTLPTEWAP